MRILHVSHGFEEGGSQLYAASVADAQASLGQRVQRFGPGGVPARRGRGFEGGFTDAETERRFSQAVLGVDVVHIHHLSGLSMGIPRLAHAAGARVVVTLHDFWLACARGQLVDGGGARCPGPATDRCAACLAPELYAPLPHRMARVMPPRTAPVRRREAAWADVRANTDLFLAPSVHVASRLGVPATHLSLPLLTPIPPAPTPPPGPIRLLFLGSLLPTKGPDVLLDAFGRLPAGSATLRIVGPSPPWRGSTRWAAAFTARASRAAAVSVAGAVPPAAIVAELHEADVLVVPSTWEENAPLVVGEAKAAGLRIVASDTGGLREVAPRARFVPPGDVEALRRALAAEVRTGRGRVEPEPPPTLRRHAQDLLDLYERRPGKPEPAR
jgi:glycosyltransferase involved in cell wall biosynthesis